MRQDPNTRRRPLVLAALSVCLTACAGTAGRAAETVESPVPVYTVPVEGVRLGLQVSALDGHEIVSVRASERFIPASNTKIFTTAAAFHWMATLDQPDPALGTTLRLLPPRMTGEAPALLLAGTGDPRLRDAPDCETDCLQDLADAVVAKGLTRVSAVRVDASALKDDRWGLGWSWNNLPFYFGAPVSAMTVNGNAVGLLVSPGAAEGQPVTATWRVGDDLLRVQIEATTAAQGSENLLSVSRWPGSDIVRLAGSLPAGSPPRTFWLSVDDPALTAGERLTRLLETRGVVVETRAQRHVPADGESEGAVIARLQAPPLLETVRTINLDSDNLAAELLLHQLARVGGGQGAEDGLGLVHRMLDAAGIGRVGVELFDGSGLSPYNRVTPQAMVDFLAWTTTQPWSDAFRATLPVGGQTGSLAGRFKGTPLEGRIFAKTGAVQGVNALSGFMTAASGETLVFSIIANDRPADSDSVIAAMDALLITVASRN